MYKIPSSDKVQISHSVDDGILTVLVSGSAPPESVVSYAEAHLDTWVNPRILWNLTKMSFVKFSLDSYKNLSIEFKRVHKVRGTGKTALLLNSEMEGPGELVVEYSKVNRAPIKIRTFTVEVDARKWLLSTGLEGKI